MQLVIAEKPSVAQTLAKVLGATDKKDGYVEGNGYIVSWCVGHLVELAPPEEYDEKYADRFNMENLPIIPHEYKFVISSNTQKQFNVLKKLMSDSRVSELVCATDAGREGECIFRYVYTAAKCRKPFLRLWTSSLEESALREGFKNLRNSQDYDNLYAAGLSRAQADWLVGMNGTRLFSNRYKAALSIGRVQTPTLAMIVDRDFKVQNFIKEKYFTVELDCGFTAETERIDEQQKAESLCTACSGGMASVTEVKKEVKTINPPKLYDLTTLQREANRKYGYTAQQTLDYVQSLYEKKLCSYPRTDSQYITSDMENTARNIVTILGTKIPEMQTAGQPNISCIINNAKVSDHYALMPTAQIEDKDLSELPDGERNILLMIAAKLICAVSDPHKYEAVTVMLFCAGSPFKATGKTVINNGWKACERRINEKFRAKPDEDASSDEAEKPVTVLPAVQQGQNLNVTAAQTKEHWTSPPKSYTEDTLLSAMEHAGNADYSDDEDVEKKGLGTPATRAAIIEGLVRKQYIERRKKQLVATDKGVNLIKVVPDEVKSAKMTADWETMLQSIEKGSSRASDFISGIEDYIRTLVSTYGSVSDSAVFRKPERVAVGKCPKCGADVKTGKYGVYCTGKCGMQLAKVFGKELTESQLQKLISGKEISFTSNGKKTTVLPEAVPYSYKNKDGKEYSGFQWKTKS